MGVVVDGVLLNVEEVGGVGGGVWMWWVGGCSVGWLRVVVGGVGVGEGWCGG